MSALLSVKNATAQLGDFVCLYASPDAIVTAMASIDFKQVKSTLFDQLVRVLLLLLPVDYCVGCEWSTYMHTWHV